MKWFLVDQKRIFPLLKVGSAIERTMRKNDSDGKNIGTAFKKMQNSYFLLFDLNFSWNVLQGVVL